MSNTDRGFLLACTSCDYEHAPGLDDLRCAECGAPYEVAYEHEPSGASPRLPLRDGAPRVTRGEGNTPLLELPRIATRLGLGRLWAKLEYQSPTGSFKDRGSAVLMSAALEAGVEEFAEDSSGNAGASLAAYAAAAGVRAHIFVPATASPGKLDQISVFGAQLHRVEGPRQAATDAAQAFVRTQGATYLSHNLSPYFAEGMKAFAYEIADSPASRATHILFPVGNGSLFLGARRGFAELASAGRVRSIPRLHCVQAEAVMPIVAAINEETWSPQNGATTVASGIAVSSPPRLRQVARAVAETGGAGVAVADGEILRWQRRLAAAEGIFGEPTSAAVLAGLEALIRRGVVEEGAEVLIPITGSGLKEPLAR